MRPCGVVAAAPDTPGRGRTCPHALPDPPLRMGCVGRGLDTMRMLHPPHREHTHRLDLPVPPAIVCPHLPLPEVPVSRSSILAAAVCGLSLVAAPRAAEARCKVEMLTDDFTGEEKIATYYYASLPRVLLSSGAYNSDLSPRLEKAGNKLELTFGVFVTGAVSSPLPPDGKLALKLDTGDVLTLSVPTGSIPEANASSAGDVYTTWRLRFPVDEAQLSKLAAGAATSAKLSLLDGDRVVRWHKRNLFPKALQTIAACMMEQ